MITATILLDVFTALGASLNPHTRHLKLLGGALASAELQGFLSRILPLVLTQEAHHRVKAQVANPNAAGAFHLKSSRKEGIVL